MGKKSGGSAPKIDPRIGEAMEKMANTMEQQQDWYQNDLYPWMQAQAIKQNQAAEEDRRVAYQNYNFWQDFATKQYDEQKELADFYFNRYLNDLKPVEDSLIADANKYNTSAEAERQAGYAIADMATSQAGQRQAANMQMQQYGINPTAGAYQAQNRAQDIQNAAIRGAAANQARQAAEALGWQKKAQVASLGQNYINNSNTATQLAYTGTQLGANNANQALGQASALGQVGLNNIATVGNMGLQQYNSLLNGWGQYGNMGLAVSNYNLNAYNASQANKRANQNQFWGNLNNAFGFLDTYFPGTVMGPNSLNQFNTFAGPQAFQQMSSGFGNIMGGIGGV